ncbi:EamA family transporter [Bacillus sp. JJ1764]|uniref:EamA family transporter n=1 Tax=Bacillus sp. JJ1764 TaxID=3122964 RepID=UPI002FFFAB99
MQNFKYSLLVLLGGLSYGLLSTVVKLGFLDGFSVQEQIGGQYLFGWLVLLLIDLLFSRHKVLKKQVIILLIVGTTMSMTGIFYGFAVEELSASVAVVFLFQFSWMGVFIEAFANKIFPSLGKILSVIILFIGTLFAGGVFQGFLQEFSWKGIIFGLLAALSFSFYIFVSSRVATEVPPYTKSLIMATGATIMICIAFPPVFIIDGTLQSGLWKYSVFLGLFGIVIPNVCFTIGAPKVGPGLSTILGSIELPTAIIASITLLNEAVSVLQWVGIALILFGIIAPQYLLNWKEKRQFSKEVA